MALRNVHGDRSRRRRQPEHGDGMGLAWRCTNRSGSAVALCRQEQRCRESNGYPASGMTRVPITGTLINFALASQRRLFFEVYANLHKGTSDTGSWTNTYLLLNGPAVGSISLLSANLTFLNQGSDHTIRVPNEMVLPAGTVLAAATRRQYTGCRSSISGTRFPPFTRITDVDGRPREERNHERHARHRNRMAGTGRRSRNRTDPRRRRRRHARRGGRRTGAGMSLRRDVIPSPNYSSRGGLRVSGWSCCTRPKVRGRISP